MNFNISKMVYPVGVEFFSYANPFLFQYICIDTGHVSESALLK